jgi:hypothetical protein
MSSDIPAIFSKIVGKKSTPYVPKVSAEGKKFKPSTLIAAVVDEISEERKKILEGDSIGMQTIAVYILNEILHREGRQAEATKLISSPKDLYKISIFGALFLEAGRKIPSEVDIDTEEASPTDLWNDPASGSATGSGND